MSESMCMCCEVRKITKPELGLCGRCAKARPCCTFHADGGSPDLSCGGDHPNIGGTHLRDCSYHGGGDCTCGRGVPEGGAE